MSVAVVIPNRNYGLYLGECLWSVIHQTVQPQEVIVVDSSRDLSARVFYSWSQRSIDEGSSIVWQWISAEPKGIANARNLGIAATQCDLIVPLDADDWLEPTYIERCLPLMEQQDVGIVTTGLRYCPDGRVQFPAEPINVDRLREENRLFTCSMFRREAWEAAGGYDETPCYEDWLLWLTIVSKGWDVAVVREPLFNYRLHEGSSCTRVTPEMHEAYTRYVQTKLISGNRDGTVPGASAEVRPST